jgi:hypothetical protein
MDKCCKSLVLSTHDNHNCCELLIRKGHMILIWRICTIAPELLIWFWFGKTGLVLSYLKTRHSYELWYTPMNAHEVHRSSAHYGHKHLHPCYYILHFLCLLSPTSRSFGRSASCLQHSNHIEMLPSHSLVLLLDIMNCCTRLLIMWNCEEGWNTKTGT